MNIKLLDFIVCVKCGESNFKLTVEKEEQNIVEKGALTCRNCGAEFFINKAVVCLNEKFSDLAQKEKKSHEREIIAQKEPLNFKNEEWLLNFPDVSRQGADKRTERISRLISENTVLSLKKIINSGNNSILEIGAGNCWATARMAVNNYCIALDILNLPPTGLEAGKVFIENKKIYFERVLADMINLPFKPAVFDYVVISSSLHHSSDIKKTLLQINKLIKPGGKLVLLNEPSTGLLGGGERRRVDFDLNEGFNETRHTINEWKKLFADSDFKAKILLPENLSSILRARGGIYEKISFIIKLSFLKQMIEIFLSAAILKFFDGYFNALLRKK